MTSGARKRRRVRQNPAVAVESSSVSSAGGANPGAGVVHVKEKPLMVHWANNSSPIVSIKRGGQSAIPECCLLPLEQWPESEFKVTVSTWRNKKDEILLVLGPNYLRLTRSKK